MNDVFSMHLYSSLQASYKLKYTILEYNLFRFQPLFFSKTANPFRLMILKIDRFAVR